jgi:hypothetical protein
MCRELLDSDGGTRAVRGTLEGTFVGYPPKCFKSEFMMRIWMCPRHPDETRDSSLDSELKNLSNETKNVQIGYQRQKLRFSVRALSLYTSAWNRA